MKSKRLRWAGYVATDARDKEYMQNFGRKKVLGNVHLEDQEVDGS